MGKGTAANDNCWRWWALSLHNRQVEDVHVRLFVYSELLEQARRVVEALLNVEVLKLALFLEVLNKGRGLSVVDDKSVFDDSLRIIDPLLEPRLPVTFIAVRWLWQQWGHVQVACMWGEALVRVCIFVREYRVSACVKRVPS